MFCFVHQPMVKSQSTHSPVCIPASDKTNRWALIPITLQLRIRNKKNFQLVFRTANSNVGLFDEVQWIWTEPFNFTPHWSLDVTFRLSATKTTTNFEEYMRETRCTTVLQSECTPTLSSCCIFWANVLCYRSWRGPNSSSSSSEIVTFHSFSIVKLCCTDRFGFSCGGFVGWGRGQRGLVCPSPANEFTPWHCVKWQSCFMHTC